MIWAALEWAVVALRIFAARIIKQRDSKARSTWPPARLSFHACGHQRSSVDRRLAWSL
jgi:hypothetical protein